MKNVYRILYIGVSVFFSILCSRHTFSQTNFWGQTNGPPGGEVQAIAFNSTGYIFAGTSTGGVYHSINAGATWIEANNGIPNVPGKSMKSVRALTINSHGVLFAATSDSGIYRSTNNGNNWSQTSLTNIKVSGFSVNSSGHIFASSSFSCGIFRSTDDGNTWVSDTNGLGDASIYSLAIDSNGYVFAGSYGVFRSTNNGDNWTAVGLSNKWVYSLAIAPSNDILAWTDSLFRSTDNGLTWSYVNIGLTSLYAINKLAGSRSGASSGSIFANGYDYSGSGGVFRSTNNGVTWTRINNGLRDSLNLRSLAISPTGDVFVGTEHGLFRSTNSGNNWFLAGVPNSYIAALTPNIGGQIFAATFWEFTRGILFRTPNDGANWIEDNTGLESTIVTCLATNSPGHLLAGTLRGIYRSTSVGGSWSSIALTNASVGSFVRTLSGDILVGTNIGVYRSTDEGTNWAYSSAGLTNTYVPRLVVNTNGNIFAGTRAGIFRSSNGGITWGFAGTGVTDTVITALIANSAGHVLSGTRLGVFRSTNNGNSWSQMNVGLTNTDVSSLAVNTIDHIFAGTTTGVFRSTDNAETWSNVDQALRNTFVTSLSITPAGLLLAGTYGSGVLRSVQSTTSVESTINATPPAFFLQQNYPNPFNPKTEVGFRIADRGFVSLKVYDVLGREVATLVNEVQETGFKSVQFDGRALASGVYLYQLRAGAFVSTKKFILMR